MTSCGGEAALAAGGDSAAAAPSTNHTFTGGDSALAAPLANRNTGDDSAAAASRDLIDDGNLGFAINNGKHSTAVSSDVNDFWQRMDLYGETVQPRDWCSLEKQLPELPACFPIECYDSESSLSASEKNARLRAWR